VTLDTSMSHRQRDGRRVTGDTWINLSDSPWDLQVLACPSGRWARSARAGPSPLVRRPRPESPVCLRVREDPRLLADRVVPAARVHPALPVTSQERYVVTAFLSGESPRHKSVSRYSSVCATDWRGIDEGKREEGGGSKKESRMCGVRSLGRMRMAEQ